MRNLRMLRVDDLLTDVRSRTAESAAQMPYKNITPIEIEDGKQHVIGIRGWRSSIHFWLNLRSNEPIDLIVSDVQFQNSGSPLHAGTLGEDLKAPLGLTHFKSLAAYATAQNRPFGYALHTADKDRWKNELNSSDIPKQIMARLAIHEMGEISAILSEAVELDHAIEKGSNYAEIEQICLGWFDSLFQLANYETSSKRGTNSRTVKTFQDAQPIAMAKYRKSFPLAKVRPSSWNDLRKWTANAEKKLKKKQDVFLDKYLSIQLILPDGTIDTIRLQSIFADCEKDNRFEIMKLSKEHITYDKNSEFHLLTADNYPRLGAFIHECGSLGRAFEEAMRICRMFPLPNIKTNNEEDPAGIDVDSIRIVDTIGENPLDLALAIILKYIECQKWLQDRWDTSCRETNSVYFDPEEVKFTSSRSDGSLDQFVKRTIIPSLESNPDGLNLKTLSSKVEQTQSSVKYIMDLLERSGMIYKNESRYLICKEGDRRTRYLRPSNKADYKNFGDVINPKNRISNENADLSQNKFAFTTPTMNKISKPSAWLEVVFSNHQFVELDRALKSIHETFKLKDIEENIASIPWLQALCQDYCEEIGWIDKFEWPKCILREQ